MPGAAWKLTALAACLSVGFFGLMQVQQNLNPIAQNSDNPPENASTESPVESVSDAESPYFTHQSGPGQQSEGYASSQGDGHSSSSPERMTANNDSFLVQDNSWGQDVAPADSTNPSAATHDPFSNENQTASPADPFSQFQKPVEQAIQTTAKELQEGQQELAAHVQQTTDTITTQADNWQHQILQTAHDVNSELKEDIQQAGHQLNTAFPAPPQSGTEPQASPAAVELIQLASAMQPAEQTPQANASADQSTPAPFLQFSAEQAKPIEESTTTEPPAVPEMTLNLTSPNRFASAEEQTDPEEEADAPSAPQQLPVITPISSDEKLPAFPANEQPPVITPANETPVNEPPAEEPLPSLEAPADSEDEMPAESPVFDPFSAANETAPTAESEPPVQTTESFFPQEEPDETDADDPFRTVPQFNQEPASAPEITQKKEEPAPFQLSAPETNEPPPSPFAVEMPPTETSTEAAPEQIPSEPETEATPASTPAETIPAPDVTTPNPFAVQPPTEVPMSRDKSEQPERPSGFPAFPGNESVNQPVDKKPAPALPPVAEEIPAKPEMNLTTTPKPEPPMPEQVPEPAKAPTFAPKPNPFSNTSISKPALDPAIPEDELVGSARVDADAAEQLLQPKIELYKSAPENAVLGQPLIYKIEIENTGQIAVKDVVVEDKFPAGTKLTGTIPRAELVEKTLIWKFDELKPAERQKIFVRVVPIEPGKIGSVSTVSYKSTVTAQTNVTAPKLDLEMVTTAEVALNETVEIQFNISNSGEGEAQGVILRNLIPSGLEHPAGRDLEYEIGLLKGGETKSVTLTMLAKAIGEYENVATVKSTSGITANAKSGVRVIESVMSLAHQGPTRRFIGHAVEYKTTITNNTSRQLQNINAKLALPVGFQFVSADQQGQFHQESKQISWIIPEIAAGQEVIVRSKIMPTQVGTHNLSVSAVDADGYEAEVSTAVKVEGFPSLAVRLPDVRGPVLQGERVSIRFKVVNRGSAEATNVIVSCHVPQELEYLSANGPVKAIQQGEKVVFQPIARLKPEDDITFDVVFSAGKTGDSRVEFEVQSDQTSLPLKHQEQVIIYGE